MSDVEDDGGLNLRCPDCGNTVEDSPVSMDRCIECGGDLERVDGPVAPPQAPMNLPKYLREGVEKQKSPDRLRRLAEYAEAMADWREVEAERELEERAEQDVDTTPDEWDADEWEDVVDDARDEADLAPGKGTLTTKTIDDRDYYYLQWREGSKIKSQYVAPVTPADSGE